MKAIKSPLALEMQGLYKSYSARRGDRVQVLRDISLQLARGEFVSLLGPSGGGKSTLLNLAAGLDIPDEGSITLLGDPLPACGTTPGKSAPIAYMQQKDLLLPWRSLWDNLLLGPEINSPAQRTRMEATAREMMRAFHLEEFAHAYPAQLSGGMRQRAALIRTLLCGQEILLLDEPFGALDAITRARLQRHLLTVWRKYGKTVLLVTHDVEEAVLLSDRIVLLTGRPGRIKEIVPIHTPQEKRRNSLETLKLRSRILEALEADED